MIDLFLPNEDSGLFGIIAHWLGIVILFSMFLGLTTVAAYSLLLYFPALLLMMLLD
jgi:hypothetical protein